MKSSRPRRSAKDDRICYRVIVRLAPGISTATVPCHENLLSFAESMHLKELERVLKQYKIRDSRRMIPGGESLKRVLQREKQAQDSAFPPLRSLASYWVLDLSKSPQTIDPLLRDLKGLGEVDRAYRELPAGSPSYTYNPTDTFTKNDKQVYLESKDMNGLDARWAWDQGFKGAGVGLALCDDQWNAKHRDLLSKGPFPLLHGVNWRTDSGVNALDHGTAALGILIAAANGEGIVGIAHEAGPVKITSHYNGTAKWLITDALTQAILNLNPGDVILLEVQRFSDETPDTPLKLTTGPIPPDIALPVEVNDADFDILRLAAAYNIIVVEAAGNGMQDLDKLIISSGTATRLLSRTGGVIVPAYDSGAILVAASAGATSRFALASSNHGTRVDCFAWGNDVVTTGYGTWVDPSVGSAPGGVPLGPGEAIEDRHYTADKFGETSAASAIVAGAALVVQGAYKAKTSGGILSVPQMRDLLRTHGLDHEGAKKIGIMPNLKLIVDDKLKLTPDLYLRDTLSDTGLVPTSGVASASPDIIVRTSKVLNPATAFGEGSGTENNGALSDPVGSAKDHFIYVRMKNRGLGDAPQAKAEVYWSKPATLVTPDVWNLIGTTSPVDVPQGDTLVVTDPLTWPAAAVPGPGHYCFVARAGNSLDPMPLLPLAGGALDWNAFVAFIQNHNNVAWRNFNVLSDPPGTGGSGSGCDFFMRGAPDQERAFDLELRQRLPRGVALRLELPEDLLRRLNRELGWSVGRSSRKGMAGLHLPPLPALQISRLILPKRANYPCRFVLVDAKKAIRSGHEVAIRQFHDGVEVGRITWQFQLRALGPRQIPRRRD